jgi:phosphoglycolate phosphatase
MITHLGYPVPDDTELNSWIGPPIHEKLASTFSVTGPRAVEAVEVFREYYSQQGYRENRLYEGIPELLESLRTHGLDLVIATSKPTEHAMLVLDHFSLSPLFSSVYANSLDDRRPTKSDVIRHAITSHRLEERKEQIVMIGDRSHDLCGAAENGIDAIGVLYGFAQPGEFDACSPKALVEHPAQIVDYLNTPGGQYGIL